MTNIKDSKYHVETVSTCGGFLEISPAKHDEKGRLSQDNPRDTFFRKFLMIKSTSNSHNCESVAETFFQMVDECKDEDAKIRKLEPV